MNSFNSIYNTPNIGSVEIRSPSKERDIHGILELQALNAPANLSEIEMNKEGFVKRRPLTSYAVIKDGQTCIAKAFRGSGLLERLYARMETGTP